MKGRHAGYRSLCCEWVAGRLAKVAGLVLPDITIAEVPRALVTASEREDIGQLGAGPVFASRQVKGAREMAWQDVLNLGTHEMNQALFFDLWVQNEDRTLSVLGGNPNLLVTHETEIWEGEETGKRYRQLWVIDFNLAFDPTFTRKVLMEHHAFAEQFIKKGWNPGFREAMSAVLPELLAQVPRLFEELPEEWLYPDGDDSLPVHLNQNDVLKTLQLPLQEPETFWTL